jgi:hypothetical protein
MLLYFKANNITLLALKCSYLNLEDIFFEVNKQAEIFYYKMCFDAILNVLCKFLLKIGMVDPSNNFFIFY